MDKTLIGFVKEKRQLPIWGTKTRIEPPVFTSRVENAMNSYRCVLCKSDENKQLSRIHPVLKFTIDWVNNMNKVILAIRN